MEQSGELRDKTYVVTGAGSGIGLATTRWLLDRGANVAMLDSDRTALQAVESELKSAGARITMIVADIRDSAALADAVAEARAKWKRPLSGLVNSAGIARNVAFMDTSADLMREVFEVNVIGTMHAAQAFVAAADSKDAAIVNVASISGMIGNSGRSAYGASKGAVISLTEVMAIELAEKGIRVNAVAPGPVETPMIKGMNLEAAKKIWFQRLPKKRFGQADEIAAAIGFLVSPSAAFVSGQVLVVDGGFLGAGIDARTVTGS